MEEGGLFHRMKRIFQVEEEMDEDTVKEAAGLIRNIFRYMDKDAKDIMTHRKNIVAVDGNEPLEVALKFMLEESYSRFPIYGEDIDEIVKVIHRQGAMTCYLDERLRPDLVKDLKDYIRPVTLFRRRRALTPCLKRCRRRKPYRHRPG